jgi:hypothetical protein
MAKPKATRRRDPERCESLVSIRAHLSAFNDQGQARPNTGARVAVFASGPAAAAANGRLHDPAPSAGWRHESCFVIRSMKRKMNGKKLLVARVGLGSLTFALCGAFPGCNLLPPPRCADGTYDYDCARDALDTRAPEAGGADTAAEGSGDRHGD